MPDQTDGGGFPLWPIFVALPISPVCFIAAALFVFSAPLVGIAFAALPPAVGLALLLRDRTRSFGFGLLCGWPIAPVVAIALLAVAQ